MPRRRQQRRVQGLPPCACFKPAGQPAAGLGEVLLSVAEYEALRLADYEGQYQEQAAQAMDVSRPTFGRILESARRKVASALVEGKALRIEGGAYTLEELRVFACGSCNGNWSLPYGGGRPAACPQCGSADIFRVDGQRGGGRGRGCGRGRRGGRQ